MTWDKAAKEILENNQELWERLAGLHSKVDGVWLPVEQLRERTPEEKVKLRDHSFFKKEEKECQTK